MNIIFVLMVYVNNARRDGVIMEEFDTEIECLLEARFVNNTPDLDRKVYCESRIVR